MLIKRQDHLFIEWTASGLFIIAPINARTKLNVNEAAIRAISKLEAWTDADEFIATIKGKSRDKTQAESLLRHLLELGVLLEKDENFPEANDRIWEQWGRVAKLFHIHSRNAPYLVAEEEKKRSINSLGSIEPPTALKTYPDKERIRLSNSSSELDANFGNVLRLRRTHRHFTDSHVTLADFSALLQTTFAPQRYCDGGVFGSHQLRTSPNAGARHEIECYVAALNIESIPRGIYHYNVAEHSIELLIDGVDESLLQHLLYQQPFSKTAPLICFTTAVPERISHKYQDGRAYRLWMLNVGHVGQTFALTATALGLGAFQTAAFRDSETDELLGLDSTSEFVTYVLGCGNVSDPQAPEGITFIEPV